MFNVFASNPVAMPWPQINGNSSPPSVDYIGGAPTFLCGVEQINVAIPLDARAGPYAIRASQVDSLIYIK
ncbi:MAG TPA: hypothetical protein VKS01_04415, partial [Bryobacteraceae bacterium]|nr:hypothetical protein [Bryobacteraceae bacterium]